MSTVHLFQRGIGRTENLASESTSPAAPADPRSSGRQKLPHEKVHAGAVIRWVCRLLLGNCWASREGEHSSWVSYFGNTFLSLRFLPCDRETNSTREGHFLKACSCFSHGCQCSNLNRDMVVLDRFLDASNYSWWMCFLMVQKHCQPWETLLSNGNVKYICIYFNPQTNVKCFF